MGQIEAGVTGVPDNGTEAPPSSNINVNSPLLCGEFVDVLSGGQPSPCSLIAQAKM
jgi:hypothetical protein